MTVPEITRLLAKMQAWQDGADRAKGRAETAKAMTEARELLTELANMLTEARRAMLGSGR